MRENLRTFIATHKIIVAANTRPIVRGTDDGIWRRMRLVPWDVRIPHAEQDRELPARLIATEAPGILAWLVDGCLAWFGSGLATVDAITSATDGYRADQDTLGRWIEDRCVRLGRAGNEVDEDRGNARGTDAPDAREDSRCMEARALDAHLWAHAHRR